MSGPKKTIVKSSTRNTPREPISPAYSPTSPPYSPSAFDTSSPMDPSINANNTPSHNSPGCNHSWDDECVFIRKHSQNFDFLTDQKMFVAMFPTLYCAYELFTQGDCVSVDMYVSADSLGVKRAAQMDTATLAKWGEFGCARSLYGDHSANIPRDGGPGQFPQQPYITPFFSVQKLSTGMGFCKHQPTRVTFRADRVNDVHRALSKAFVHLW
jgi:hypothetical protein